MIDLRTRRAISAFLEMDESKISDIATTTQSHFILNIDLEIDKYHIFLVTKRTNGLPERIFNRPKGVKKSSWTTALCYADSELLIYNVIIPRIQLASEGRFFIESEGKWIRVLAPYHSDLVLPEGWGFSRNHLYATYQSTEPEKDRVQRAFVRRMSVNEGKLVVEGVLITNYPPEGASLTIRKFRDGAFSWDFPLEIIPAHRVWGQIASAYTAYRNENAYKFRCEIDLPWSKLISSIYTAIIHIGENSSGLYSYNSNFSQKNGMLEIDNRTVHAYVDVVASNVRIEIYDFNRKFARDAIKNSKTTRASSDVPVCLVGEYTNAARDNGLRLFKSAAYSKDIEYWYVAEEGCGVSGHRFVKFGSKRHFELSLKAKCIAFTHHPNYVLPNLPWSNREGDQPKTLFLQHGVTALKNSMPSYHSSKRKFDVFAVCSEREQASVVEACKYPIADVRVIGMPRLDNLMSMSKAHLGQRSDFIIFPTWRRGLDKIHGSDFLDTEFYRMWSLAMQRITSACRESGKRTILVSHPIIDHHVEYFKDFVDQIIDIEDVQQAMCAAYMLITDYSSICFDAIYIDVPVAFFTFDEVEYGFQRDAFIDVETDLPGVHCRSIGELDQHLSSLDEFSALAKKCADSTMPMYFDNIDLENSKRAHEMIKELTT